MRSGSGRSDRRRRASEAPAQPELPEGEARLLSVRERDGSVVIEMDSGLTYELAPGSVPADLPESGVVSMAVHQAIAVAAARKSAARRLFTLLDRRLQPVARLRKRLLEEGYLSEAVEQVLDSMQQQGLHSDRHYADAYCRDCLLSRAVGPRYLETKLRDKGIPGGIARQAAQAAVPPEMEEDLARRAATARWRKLGGSVEMRDVARVVRHLQSRGFGPGIANAIARQTRPDRPVGDASDGNGEIP